MKSKHTQIAVTKSTLDSKKRTIDADIDADIKGIKVGAVVSGSLDAPKVKVDTSALIKSGAKQKAVDQIEKQIDKHLGGSDKVKSLLKGFFK